MEFSRLNKHHAVFTEDPVNLSLSPDEDSFLGNIIEHIENSGDFYGKQICEKAKDSVVRLFHGRQTFNEEYTIVDPLGFYMFANGPKPKYEAPFIGLVIDKIQDTAMNLYEVGIKNLEHLTLDEIKEFLLAKVLLHELAHAWLDVNDFNLHHQNSLIFMMEEPMANCITLALAHLTHNTDFIGFVEYFIRNCQDSLYKYGYNLYVLISTLPLVLCGEWRNLKSNNQQGIIDGKKFNAIDLENGVYFNNNNLANHIINKLIRNTTIDRKTPNNFLTHKEIIAYSFDGGPLEVGIIKASKMYSGFVEYVLQKKYINQQFITNYQNIYHPLAIKALNNLTFIQNIPLVTHMSNEEKIKGIKAILEEAFRNGHNLSIRILTQ